MDRHGLECASPPTATVGRIPRRRNERSLNQRLVGSIPTAASTDLSIRTMARFAVAFGAEVPTCLVANSSGFREVPGFNRLPCAASWQQCSIHETSGGCIL